MWPVVSPQLISKRIYNVNKWHAYVYFGIFFSASKFTHTHTHIKLYIQYTGISWLNTNARARILKPIRKWQVLNSHLNASLLNFSVFIRSLAFFFNLSIYNGNGIYVIYLCVCVCVPACVYWFLVRWINWEWKKKEYEFKVRKKGTYHRHAASSHIRWCCVCVCSCA